MVSERETGRSLQPWVTFHSHQQTPGLEETEERICVLPLSFISPVSAPGRVWKRLMSWDLSKQMEEPPNMHIGERGAHTHRRC